MRELRFVEGPDLNPIDAEPPDLNDFIIEVDGVTKVYRRWRSPMRWLLFRLLEQLVRWAPVRVKAAVAEIKARACHEFTALRSVSFRLRRGDSLGILNGEANDP